MARRMWASRSALLQRICSEGRLSDLAAADDSRLATPSTVSAGPAPPPAPRSTVAAPPAPAAAKPTEVVLTPPPHLPRIRTRVQRRSPAGSASSGSGGGGWQR